MNYIKIVVFAFIAMTASTQSVFSQATLTDQATANLKTATVKVKGITCASDLAMISENVEKVEGVSSCVAEKQGPTSTFEVKYNPALITEEAIFAAIESTKSCKNPDVFPYKVRQ